MKAQRTVAVTLGCSEDAGRTSVSPQRFSRRLLKDFRLLEYRLQEDMAAVARIQAARDSVESDSESLHRPAEQQERYDVVLASARALG